MITMTLRYGGIVNEITDNHNGTGFVARRDRDKITCRRASIEKIRGVLGYEPKMKMRGGMKRIYDWIIENRSQIEGVRAIID